MPRQNVPALRCKKTKTVIQLLRYLLQRQYPHPRRRQLYGQRYPVQRFLGRVLDIEEKLKDPGFAGKKEMENYLSETLSGWKNIFQISEKDGKTMLRRNEKEIAERLERMGIMILLANRAMQADEILHLYRRKDAAEKLFDAVKHELERKRLRIHTQQTFEGRLFLDFVALIIHSWTSRRMRREGISKDLTVQELMYELEKIKLIHLGEKKP